MTPSKIKDPKTPWADLQIGDLIPLDASLGYYYKIEAKYKKDGESFIDVSITTTFYACEKDWMIIQ